jgi:hypothetical protein
VVGEPKPWPALRALRASRRVGFLKDAIDQRTLDTFTGPQIFQLPCTREEFDLIDGFRRRGQTVLAEFDDDYTRWDDRYANVKGERWEKYDRNTTSRWAPSIEMARACAQEASGVIVSTPFLKKLFDDLNRSVFVCRNSVDPADWPAVERDESSPFRAVYAVAPNNHDNARARKAMEWLAAKPDAEAVVVGQDPGWANVKTVPWIADLSLLRQFLTALAPDVGLRPVEQTRFARGKSDLKVLEYAMCGALSIVSPGEPYKDWDGLAWFARTADDFVEKTRLAYEYGDETRKIAGYARAAVLESRTIQTECQAWASAIRSCSSL